MSRSTVVGVIAASLMVSLLVGLYVLPRWLADSAAKDAAAKVARDSAPAAIQPVVRDAANAEARKVAQGLADRAAAEPKPKQAVAEPGVDITLAEAADRIAGSVKTTVSDAGSAEPSPTGAVVTVEREAFSLTAPPGSTVDEPSHEVDAEHLIGVHMPGSASVHIVVVDDKSFAREAADRTTQELRSKLKEATDFTGGALSWSQFVHVKALRGKLNGRSFGYETALIEGKDKDCLVMAQYPLALDRSKSDAMMRIHDALATMRMR